MKRDSKGYFAKGNKGKQKGAVNKITQQAREIFLETLEGQVPHISKAFDDVRMDDPAKFLELFAKYAQYFVPKKTASEMDINLKTEQPLFPDLE